MNQTPPHRLNRFEKSIVITTQKTSTGKTYSVGALSPEKYQIEFFKTKYLNLLKEQKYKNTQIDALQMENSRLKINLQEALSLLDLLRTEYEKKEQAPAMFPIKTTTYELVVLQHALAQLQLIKKKVQSLDTESQERNNMLALLSLENAKLKKMTEKIETSLGTSQVTPTMTQL